MRKKLFYLICTLCVGLLLPLNIWADGGSYRPPTPQEKAYYESTFKTLQKAIPKCPGGWTLTSETNQNTITRIPTDSEKSLFQIIYAIEWQDVNKKNAGDNKAVQAGASVMKNYSGQAKIDALNAEHKKKIEEYGKALKSNNMAAAERIMKEMDAIGAKMNAAYADLEKSVDTALAANEAHDFSLRITLRVNWNSDIYDKLTPAAPVAGLPVYRVPGGHVKDKGWVLEHHYVFLGKIQSPVYSNGCSVLKKKPTPGAPHTSTQWIVVEVEADQARARAALEQINWNLLKSILR